MRILHRTIRQDVSKLKDDRHHLTFAVVLADWCSSYILFSGCYQDGRNNPHRQCNNTEVVVIKTVYRSPQESIRIVNTKHESKSTYEKSTTASQSPSYAMTIPIDPIRIPKPALVHTLRVFLWTSPVAEHSRFDGYLRCTYKPAS